LFIKFDMQYFKRSHKFV